MNCRKSPQHIVDNLLNDQIILTANRRLATFLHKEYDEAQKSTNQVAWQRPNIFAFTTWLTTVWEQMETKPLRLLTPFQEQAIWQTIIRNADQPLIQINNTAKLAIQAWQFLQHWQLELASIDSAGNEEIKCFIHWANEFQQLCSKNAWISASQIPAELIKHQQQLIKFLPEEIILSGFDDLVPVHQHLLHLIEKQSTVRHENISLKADTIQQAHVVDEETEIVSMALWAKQMHFEHPDWQIGCVAPELHRNRDAIERHFTEIFSFAKLLPGNEVAQNPFNISSGQALIYFPLINTLFLAIQLSTGKLDRLTCSELFQSAYLAIHPDDICLGALVDAEIRRFPTQKIPLQHLFNPFSKLIQYYPNATWLRRWQKLIEIQQQLPKTALPSLWATHFLKIITSLGFPGYRSLSSLEYQLSKRFQQLLLEFSSLDIQGPISLFTALSLLQQLAQQTVFQAQTTNTPIQVLGILEAIGCHYDALWVMGMHDTAWPPPAKPNPFLPYALQVKHNMPHANSARELEYTSQLTTRLKQSARHIVFSSPQTLGDQQLRPSKLIEDAPHIELEKLIATNHQSYITTVFSNQQKETIEDDTGPAVAENENIAGGSWILKEQSACPFRAFSHIRLQANNVEDNVLGISAAQKGTILHHVLEQLWQSLRTQQALCQIADDALQEKINQVVHSVMHRASIDPYFCASPVIRELEAQRLTQLAFEWLQFEKQRPPFKVVHQEKQQHIKLDQLSLQLRIDRIDELVDGQQIIIDYKTGMTSINDWFGDRPKDPQLPLYCVADYNEKISFQGICFAQVRSNNMKFKGISQENFNNTKLIAGVIPINQINQSTTALHWTELIEEWKNNLTQLAADFSKGAANVAPRDSSSCQFCDLVNFCRINEDE